MIDILLMNINPNDISFKELKLNLYDILIENQTVDIDLLNCNIPFGIEKNKYKNKKNYIVKIELNDSQINFFIEFEKLILKKINNDLELQTQIKYSDKFKNKLITKVKTINDKIQTVCTDNKNDVSIFEIIKKKNITMKLTPYVYHDETKMIIKWFIQKICV